MNELILMKKLIDKFLKNKLFVQIIKFGIVGFLAFVVDYLSLILFKEVFHIDLFISTFLAFSISVIFNYILSIKYVFTVDNQKNNFVPFVILSIIGLLLTELIMYLGTDICKINYLIVKIIATCIVMIFNFITRKLLLEKHKER